MTATPLVTKAQSEQHYSQDSVTLLLFTPDKYSGETWFKSNKGLWVNMTMDKKTNTYLRLLKGNPG